MKKFFSPLFFGIIFFISTQTIADISGNFSLELSHFPQQAVQKIQANNNISISLQPEFKHKWDNDHNAFTFIPFYRWDKQDKKRTHGDIRQLDLIMAKKDWEIQAGISKVFWGVTESQHLVDIINQTDAAENSDGEDKLGQPLLRVSRMINNGSVDFYILPYFRERTFRGEKGRFRSPLIVDTNQTTYESSAKEKHVDYALRWSQSINKFDIGVHAFKGTSREPEFKQSIKNGQPVLIPYYSQIEQAGLDLQYTKDAWLWKFEGLQRRSKNKRYHAAVGGFEYTFNGIKKTPKDLGILAEYHYDTRKQNTPTPFQKDLFLATRLSFNDTQSTELLAGGIFDLDSNGKSFRVEGSRRLGKNYKINLEAQAIVDTKSTDPMHNFRQDDHVLLELQRFF